MKSHFLLHIHKNNSHLENYTCSNNRVKPFPNIFFIILLYYECNDFQIQSIKDVMDNIHIINSCPSVLLLMRLKRDMAFLTDTNCKNRCSYLFKRNLSI